MRFFIVHPVSCLAIMCAFALASCTSYGKKVTFEDNKGEVYYKGEGVTENDAKATGKFLEEQEYFLKDNKERSVQISKDGGRIKIRFVVDQKALASIPNADETFALMGALLSREVFNSTPVDVIYTDETFKDIQSIPFKATAEARANVYEDLKQMQKKAFNKNTLYYAKNITGEEVDTIFNYLVKSEFFMNEGNVDLLLAKTATNGFHFRFPVKASFSNAEGLQKVDDYVKQLKQALFKNTVLEFEVLDENMVSLKTFTY